MNVFKKDNILNLTAIIGENGSGKTTLLQFLNSLSCTPLKNSKSDEYWEYTEKRNREEAFVAVYLVNGQIRIINKIGRVIYYKDQKIQSLTSDDFRYNNLLDETTHIYFTNSEYAIDSNLYHRDIDHISLHNKALEFAAQNFYKYTVMYGDNFSNDRDGFDDFQKFIIDKKTNRDFQQILDVMFLYRTVIQKRKDQYLGKPISLVQISFCSVLKYINDVIIQHPNSRLAEIFQSKFKDIGGIREGLKNQSYSTFDFLIINLAAELHYLYDFRTEKINGSEIFEDCTEFINDIKDQTIKRYYKDAVSEIKFFYKLTTKYNIYSNTFPKQDSLYREWYNVSIFELGEFFESLKKRKGRSFIAKYILIGGLELSSGERALLNFSSRVEMLDYLYELEGRGAYATRDNILFLFDEIDLYVHPNAQKKLINSLTKQINSLFRGKNVQIVISSHSPIVLSDIPSENTIYLKKEGTWSSIVLSGRKEAQTFAANIPSLYRNSFFIEGGIGVGDYALNMINKIAVELKNRINLDEERLEYCKQVIQLIGEPILRKKLKEMLPVNNAVKSNSQAKEEKGNRNEYLAFLKKQRVLIESEIKRLENEYDD